jgi:hypothetical protein
MTAEIMEMPIAVKGPAGNLECLWSECAGAHSAGLICHPHPLYGGSMYDAVVETIGQAMLANSIPVLRFNFRGVGDSEGSHDQGEGEAADVNCLLDWIRDTRGTSSIYLAGYSFGAMVALNAACTRPDRIRHLFLVALPVGYQSMPPTVSCSATTIIGDRDQMVDRSTLDSWVKGAGIEEDYHRVSGADHFFTGCYTELAEVIGRKLKQLEEVQP